MSEAFLDRARAGDPEAFSGLVAPYLDELRLHCYRMLGSLADAEDTLQETLLAAWRGLPGFEGRASPRTWLYRIATNRCLNALRDAGRRRPPEPVPPFDPPEPTRRGEVTWLEPYPDTLLAGIADTSPGPERRYEGREAVELAFIVGLQCLPPRQAAALLLRDVLGFSAVETAGMLGTSPTAVKGMLQRARTRIGQQRGVRDQGRAPLPGSRGERDLIRRFVDAFTADDIDGVVELLADDAWLAMPPAPHEYHGHAAIADFLRVSAAWRGTRKLRLVPTRANSQPAFACYIAEPGESAGWPAGLLVLTLAGERIRAITRFLDLDLARRCGVPPG